jgi:hypothetical protein
MAPTSDMLKRVRQQWITRLQECINQNGEHVKYTYKMAYSSMFPSYLAFLTLARLLELAECVCVLYQRQLKPHIHV